MAFVPGSTGAAYIDNYTVGKKTYFRTSNAATVDTTAITIDSNGFVGIGTTPGARLHVAGTLTSTSNMGGYFTNTFTPSGASNDYQIIALPTTGGSNAGTLTGVYERATLGAGTTIGTHYGLYVADPISTGTISGNNFGLYIENMTKGAGNYSIYAAGGNAYFGNDVSALSFTDRTPYPKDLSQAYEAVMSMERLPDGEYDENDKEHQLDHSKLSPFVKSDSGNRDLSATVSSINEVTKFILKTIGGESHDLSENYPTKDKTIKPGELVMTSNLPGAYVERSRPSKDSKVLGIVSDKPGVLLGNSDSDQYKDELQVPVALSGRIPVEISLENGPIKKADYLTLSKTKPGAAAKLVGSGQVIGIALQDYDGAPSEQIYKDQSPSQIMAFINLFYKYDDSFVPVFNGKIDSVVGEIKKLRGEVETRFDTVESRLKKLEKRKGL